MSFAPHLPNPRFARGHDQNVRAGLLPLTAYSETTPKGCLRLLRSINTFARSSLLSFVHEAISEIDRKQPAHRPVISCSLQTPMHGDLIFAESPATNRA